jgi:hypothetical protein
MSSEVLEDYALQDLQISNSNYWIRLDVFVPTHYLALEYQGEQHYMDVYSMGPQWQYLERNAEKRTICMDKGITIIEIPYWWDKKKESLVATIHQHRPDLIKDPGIGIPIPIESPKSLTQRTTVLSLANNWDGQQDLTGW